MKTEDTKSRILIKALELFSSRGYDAVSVGEIAKAVGIKAPSLYNHYPSKQAIFDAIVKETSDQFTRYTDAIAIHVQSSERDVAVFTEIAEDALVEKVHQIFDFSLHDSGIALFRKMMTIEQFRSAELSKLYTERFVERLVAYHAGIFKSLIASGELVDEDAQTLAVTYVSPILVFMGICDRQPERESECLEKIDAHVRLFYRTYNMKARKNYEER
mgnify:CR=1 FL=1